ncbi:MAG: HNH endonuclease [Deltaproteobacteria bacterium]|nr:HNH endonuclease [Deltaproteobacteria bacterium]MBI3294054.1 HNH endonuclease [Deltaproteobacteria bacterium]
MPLIILIFLIVLPSFAADLVVEGAADDKGLFIVFFGQVFSRSPHLQIDHVRPYAMGGSSRDLTNLRLLCRAHNLAKARLDFPNWHPASPLATPGKPGLCNKEACQA